MSNNTTSKGDMVTFRVDPAIKAELAKVASRNHQSLGELLRSLARDRLAAEHRQAFEAQARQQSLQAATVARDPHSEEHAVVQELDSDLEAFGDEWK